jgi:hypothetical protein
MVKRPFTALVGEERGPPIEKGDGRTHSDSANAWTLHLQRQAAGHSASEALLR